LTLLARARAESAATGALLLAICAAVGLAAGIRPALGVAAAVGIGLSLITVSDVTAGLVLFTVLSFLDVLNSTGPGGASVMKVAGLLLFGSWYAHRLVGTARSGAAVARFPPLLILCVVALALWSALSVTWAESPGAALSATTGYVLDMLLFPIAIVAIRRREHLVWVVGAFVIGAVVSTAYGFVDIIAAGALDYGRLTGGLGDANDQAAVLVAAIPLAIGLSGVVTRPWLRHLSWLAALFCLAGAINTISRGGLVALGVVMVAAVVFGGRWRARAAVLLALTALATITYFTTIAPLAARERVTNATTNGRADIWRVGWRMVEAHPLNGVGSGNFQTASVHFVQGVGSLTSARLIVDVPHVAHNVYLELLADLGIPGLLAFVGIAGLSLLAAGRAARAFERQGDTRMELLARCLVLALVAFLAADVFLSGEFSKQLWLTFALCSATLALSRSARDGTSPSEPSVSEGAYVPQFAY
jgi:putative inorganic carbon (HCO3(-)) transporter